MVDLSSMGSVIFVWEYFSRKYILSMPRMSLKIAFLRLPKNLPGPENDIRQIWNWATSVRQIKRRSWSPFYPFISLHIYSYLKCLSWSKQWLPLHSLRLMSIFRKKNHRSLHIKIDTAGCFTGQSCFCSRHISCIIKDGYNLVCPY